MSRRSGSYKQLKLQSMTDSTNNPYDNMWTYDDIWILDPARSTRKRLDAMPKLLDKEESLNDISPPKTAMFSPMQSPITYEYEEFEDYWNTPMSRSPISPRLRSVFDKEETSSMSSFNSVGIPCQSHGHGTPYNSMGSMDQTPSDITPSLQQSDDISRHYDNCTCVLCDIMKGKKSLIVFSFGILH